MGGQVKLAFSISAKNDDSLTFPFLRSRRWRYGQLLRQFKVKEIY